MRKMKRVVIKLSGEALGENAYEPQKIETITQEIVNAKKENPHVEIAIVVGGGNIWRGRESSGYGFHTADSDAIGMGATILNAGVLCRALQVKGQNATVFSSHSLYGVAKKHNIDAEIAALKNGNIVFLAGGTGAPFFTTDSAAVLRALEIRADAVLKGTKVDGVYNKNPEKDADAKKFDEISFSDALTKDLRIMDATAFALARENNLPIFIFHSFQKGNISAALQKKAIGTWVK